MPPYTITQSPLIPLPPGLSFSGLVLSGTPQSVGSYTIQPIVSDAAGHVFNGGTHNFTVTPAGAAAPLVFAGDERLLTMGRSVCRTCAAARRTVNAVIRGGTAPFTWSLSRRIDAAAGYSRCCPEETGCRHWSEAFRRRRAATRSRWSCRTQAGRR